MFVGITKDDLMVRIGAQNHEAALARPGARPMDFTGRVMTGMLFVEPSGIASDADLQRWVDESHAFVSTLPAKAPPKPKRPRKTVT